MTHPLTCCPRHCPHPHHDEPRSMLRCDRLAACPVPGADPSGCYCPPPALVEDCDGSCNPAPVVRPSPSCSMCGRDEGDGILVGYGGVCGDCTRAWA